LAGVEAGREDHNVKYQNPNVNSMSKSQIPNLKFEFDLTFTIYHLEFS